MEKKLPTDLDKISRSFPTQRPLKVLFQDEACFGRISDSVYCWAKRPHRPLVQAMLTHQYVYAYAAVCPSDGGMDSLVLPHVNGQWMQLFIDEVARRHREHNVAMVVEGAGWHKTAFAMPQNLRLHFLPPYSAELNPQEHIWHEVRETWFDNRVFESLDALEEQLVIALRALEADPTRVQSISGWNWVINYVSSGN